MKTRAFTLIELLVVIAIIGVLSAVILASLNMARNRGNNSAIKAGMKSILTQAAFYYDTNGGYGSVATTTASSANSNCGGSGFFNDPAVVSQMKSITKSSGFSSGINYMECSIPYNTYFIVVTPLASDPTQSWCISSVGASKQIPTPANISAVVSC
jgi:prepilin-type N-terminal cleavage/methylation domain-containing protein